MTRMRAGIVGTGGIAGSHARALSAYADQVELVAIAEIDPQRREKFGKEWSVPGRYPTLAAMLERERLDLVHLCTPPGVHATDAITALDAGATVICEKPPCLSLAEFDSILEAERRNPGHFVGIFQHRFGSAGQAARRLIRDGVLGRPLVAVCHTLWYRGDAYYQVEWRGRWDTEGGGPTMGHGIHQIDLLGYLLGDWTEISARAPRLARDVETEDVSLAHMTFANGAVASVVNSVLSPRQESYLRFDFELGTLEVSHLYGYSVDSWRFTPLPGSPAEEHPPWPPEGEDVPSSHRAQLGAVLASLRAGERPPATGASLRRTLEIVTGIYASAFTGRPVRRDELTADNPFYHQLNGGSGA
ncbi:Gfo/Idh/MocA family protein [Thermasporomyces composti]|jgi:predicted dehydrogenase|uniref:Putative dehydrogenase n=1 Tax=Thermasporomyces composti TaxID=696763 RepID=A0A3D9V2W4_THECX|nr:Gfo/Idh/MocA family oxidoreductase [Thermasporomyces composti]REF35839.1 putative dehydrogenase [Thermasporomyces composti]